MIGLPSLSQLDRQAATRIWLAAGPADMRCSFDRLAELARAVTDQDPLGGHLFLFRSRGGDRLKALYFDRDGYALWYKRLEEGTFKLPRIQEGTRSVELRASELAMLLDGIDLRSVRRVKRYRRTEPENGSEPVQHVEKGGKTLQNAE
jgi:transposase